MRSIPRLIVCCAAGILASPLVHAGTIPLVEYYNASVNRYFASSDAGEIQTMDGTPGWTRTGQVIQVWADAGQAQTGAAPACLYTATTIHPDLRLATVDPAECSALAALDFTAPKGQPFWAMRPINGTCPAETQPVYRGFHNTGNSFNFRYTTSLAVYQDTLDRGWGANGVVMCTPGTSTAGKADIYRLLRQATFGPTDATYAQVEQMGIPAWVNAQLAAPKSTYPVLPYVTFNAPDSCSAAGRVASDPAAICARDNYTLFQVQLRFLQNAMTGDDQLRQRVAFALSQIMVTSGTEINHAYGMSRYQQIMLDNAFGNFRSLLQEMTLSPAMGRYLDMANSNKPDPARGIAANENFAREILQLFTVGLYKLNPDGTVQRDAAGNPLPAYDQEMIEELARVFTGWTYPTVDGSTATRNNPVNYVSPMVPVQNNHDTGSKVIIDNRLIPAGQTALKDLNDALDVLFQHPNVGPFIGRQLIQKLVNGSPSPAYVTRVAAVFDNNGSGVRGDLGAVVRAILLDPEARGEFKSAATAGHLAEPVLFVTRALRGLGAQSDGVALRSQLAGMGQSLFIAPSVFNYYPPDHTLPASGSIAPEFAIFNASTIFARVNALNSFVMGNAIAADATVTGATGTSINWAPWQALAGDPAGLVDKLAWTFTSGTLSESARRSIVTAVNAVSSTDTLTRAKTAAYLVLSSSQSQVER